MCMSAPKVPQVQAAPPPVQAPAEAPMEEAPVSEVETAVTKADSDVAKKRVLRRGTKSLQTASGLNIPTVSGLNIS